MREISVRPRSAYECRVTVGPAEIREAQALRFEVFNLELKEGLDTSYQTGLDADAFDHVCEHLIVRDRTTSEVIGTYRMQSGARAARHLGYYSAAEFDLTPFEPLRKEVLELGRACVHKDHRNLAVLNLLWKGIAHYARKRELRFLIGCSSLTSQDPCEGAAMYRTLVDQFHLSPPEFQALPLPLAACPLNQLPKDRPKIPRLLEAYLSIGAKICGPPAIDWEFKTIDFLTLLDLHALSPRTLKRYLS